MKMQREILYPEEIMSHVTGYIRGRLTQARASAGVGAIDARPFTRLQCAAPQRPPSAYDILVLFRNSPDALAGK